MSDRTPFEVPPGPGTGPAGERFELSIDLLPEGAIVFSPDGTILEANRRALEQFEAESAEQLVGKSVYSLGRVREEEGREFVARLQDGKSIRFEIEILTLKGTPRRLAVVDIPLVGPSRAVERIVAIARDVTEQRQNETARDLLAAIVESSDDAIFTIATDFTIRQWNRAAEKMFGYPAQEIIGQPFTLTVVPQERELVLKTVRRLAEDTTRVNRFEGTLQRRDGSSFTASIMSFAVCSSDGKLLGYSAIHRDITDLRRAEREQALLAAIVSSTDDAVASLSTEGLITSWNRAAEAVLGFSAAEVIGQPVTIYLPPESHAFALREVQAQLESARRHQPIERVDIQLMRKDKTLIDAAIVASGIYDSNGELIGLSGIIRDVTERKRAERRIAAMASIVNASQDVVISVDQEGRISGWNPAAERVFGFKQAEALGRGIDFFVPTQEIERYLEAVRRILQTGESPSFEHNYRTGSGESATLHVNLFPIRDVNGAIAGVGGIARDITRRKTMEAQLREAHEYTRGLIESSIDAMVVVDREMRITDGNDQLARLTEVPKKRLIGSRFDAYFKDPKLAAGAIETTLSDGFITNCDLVLCAASGKEIMVSFSASIFHSAGCVFGIFGVARDVTDQRAIERKLEEERQYSRSLIECSPDALLISDPSFIVSDLNESAVEFSGYRRSELIGTRLAVLFSDPRRAADSMRAALETGLVREVELSFLTRDAREVPVAMSASVYRGADRSARGLLVDLRDISEHKHYESGRALLAAVVDSSGDAIYSESIDLTLTSWNAAAERLFGYSAAEIVGRSAALLVPLDRRNELLEHREQVRKSAKSDHYETRRLHKDGSVVDVDITVSPLLDETGTVTGLSLTAHDISDQIRMQAELREARDEAVEAARLKSEFLANMSHEIRTPLNSIIGMTGLMMEGQLTPEQREFAQDVRQSGNVLLNLINDILDFSKVAAGKVVFEELEFELTGAVEGAIDLVAEQARRKGLELTVAIDPECPQYLSGDPSRLRQVLANLLSNAVKFTKQGEVSVQVSKLSENPRETILRFEVRDTGIGIPRDKQHLLFQPFTQIDAATSRHFGGSGLGLSIARELVERMGGSIAVTSTPGVGSTFWFTAKLAKQIGAAPRASEHFAALAGARALIVDDNANNREILQRTLTRWGMQAEAAASARAALDLMRQQPAGSQFRVALIDVMMPEVDGFELARRIKAEPAFGDPAIIFVSSAGTRADFASALRGLSVRGWLMKPVPESALFRALVEVLAAQPEQRAESQPQPLLALKIPAGRKLTALIAEDNPVNQKLACLQMTKLGFQVDAVADGYEAVDALSRIPYDVVLMDCQMPEMDGYAATREIRRREGSTRHTRILAMTAHALPGDRDKCIAAGMDAYIAKPVELPALEKALAELLAGCVEATSGGAASSDRADAPAASQSRDPTHAES